ncbi:MAG: NAD(P)/FAD-dependent oxidoreductase [Methanomassiliicoccales archaeon]|nr:NAD(P)/FAD-dependent oxidoreductase [Methanomassiliicoccales archaeon]NYT16196.1 NAD(P)/FAD-dependent oxidoreductase [Methanomassiliicoccales archaeon]
MDDDIPEKGAILQRDKETFAIAPHIPGGIVSPEQLRKIADVAEKYNAKALKITSAERIAIVGIDPDDIDGAWSDLDMEPGAAIGLCVRSVRICPGTTFCKRGMQDSVGVGLKLDEKYHGMEMPQKLKMAVSGCPNCCAESKVRDIGLMGTKKGWKVFVGGSASGRARIGDQIAEDLSDEDAMKLVDRIIDFYIESGEKKRLGRFIETMGLEEFMKAVL